MKSTSCFSTSKGRGVQLSAEIATLVRLAKKARVKETISLELPRKGKASEYRRLAAGENLLVLKKKGGKGVAATL